MKIEKADQWDAVTVIRAYGDARYREGVQAGLQTALSIRRQLPPGLDQLRELVDTAIHELGEKLE